MAIHHLGEALQVVVAEEAVPEGPPLHRQLSDIPGQRHQGDDGEAPPGSQPLPELALAALSQPVEQAGEGCQGQGHRSLGEHRETETDPCRQGPAASPARIVGKRHIMAPEPQQGQAQQSAEQHVAHGSAGPDHHPGREGKGQGRRQGQAPPPQGGSRGRSLGLPAPEGVRQPQHHRHGRQGGRKTGGEGSEGIEAGGNSCIAQPHQPIDQDRLVEAWVAVDARREPVACFHHGAASSSEQRRGFINQPRTAQAPDKEPGPQQQGDHPQAQAGKVNGPCRMSCPTGAQR